VAGVAAFCQVKRLAEWDQEPTYRVLLQFSRLTTFYCGINKGVLGADFVQSNSYL
jgi:hypothetical protein